MVEMGAIAPRAGRQEFIHRVADVGPDPHQNWMTMIGGDERNTGGIKISRWGNTVNEAWLSIKHRAGVGPSEAYKFIDNTVSLGVAGLTHRWYSKGKKELEWELVLPKRPDSVKVLFDLDYPPGLTFHKQPEIHRQPGEKVPPRVQDSYAVYWSKAPIGSFHKLVHLYRNELIDADGRRAWCDMDIDPLARTLTVTMPWAFLDVARYPVVLGPTYGYTGTPATPSALAVGELIMAIPNASMSEAGYTQQIHFYGRKTGATSPELSMGVYDNANPHARVVSNGTDTITDTNYGWCTQTLSSTALSIARYGLVLVCETGQFDLPYDVATIADIRIWGGKSSPLPASLNVAEATGSWDDALVVGAYLTYTLSLSGFNKSNQVANPSKVNQVSNPAKCNQV